MEILRISNGDVLHFLGGAQKRMEGVNYRWSTHVLTTNAYDLVILYNTLTGFIATLTPSEYRKACTFEKSQLVWDLIENYCIVPENFNEQELVFLYRDSKRRPVTCTTLNTLNSYTIFTTLQCNARCFYCYEKKLENKSHMTKETAEKVAKYIEDTSYENVSIGIGWFGGEPTYNPEVMDIICDRITNANRTFTSNMISNSYLFSDEEFVKRAVDKWHLNNVQVTLDGLEETYNKAKRYIYKDDPSPFKTVIKAIHNLLNYNISVSIRLNCDLYNLDEIAKVIDFITEEFMPNPLFTAYVWPIFELNGYKRTPEQRKKLFSALQDLNQMLKENGLYTDGDLNQGITTSLCMIDSGQCVTILPDGKMGLCEHQIDNDFIGSVEDPINLDRAIITKYRQYVEHTDICKDCPLLPTCLKSPKCPSAAICDEYEKQYKIDRIAKQLHVFWKNVKTLNNNTCQSCECNEYSN